MPLSDTTATPAPGSPSSLMVSAKPDTPNSDAGIAASTGPASSPAPTKHRFSDVSHEHVHIAPIDGAVRVIVGDQYIDKPMPPTLALYYAATFLQAAREAKA